jgi:hypothetical protein
MNSAIQQGVCGGATILLKSDDNANPGIATLVASDGVRRYWPAPLNNNDVENLWIAHTIMMIDITEILMTENDFERYWESIPKRL